MPDIQKPRSHETPPRHSTEHEVRDAPLVGTNDELPVWEVKTLEREPPAGGMDREIWKGEWTKVSREGVAEVEFIREYGG